MRLWHFEKTREVSGAHANLYGKLDALSGDCTSVWGRSLIRGDVSALQGCLTGLSGECKGLSGPVSQLRGDITGITGRIDPRLMGDVSGLRGRVTGAWGKADGLRGEVQELLDSGLLWLKGEELKLENFASRYNLPMEFLDNSGSPALIAYHAVEDVPLHWLAVRNSRAEGFVVGPLAEIAKRFPGQEIIKAAVPSEADWQISDDLAVLRTDRLFAFEHVDTLVSNVAL